MTEALKNVRRQLIAIAEQLENGELEAQCTASVLFTLAAAMHDPAAVAALMIMTTQFSEDHLARMEAASNESR